MNNQPLVSIITPFLNKEKFIGECIESVLKQTYNNWELMLIDDGSSDNSTQIARQYADWYPEKIYYREHKNHENQGASASRNLGIQTSKGSFIAFLDSDDIYLPRKLEEQVALLNSQPQAGMLYASTEYWCSWAGASQDSAKDWVWNNFGVLPDSLIAPPALLTLFLQDGGTVPCMGSVLVRRHAIEFVGGWENTFRYIYTDQVFHAKMSLNWPIFISSGCWDRYRQHPDSSCRIVEKTGQANNARLTYLLWLEKYLTSEGVGKDTELWKALQQALFPLRYPFLNNLGRSKNKIVRRAKMAIKQLVPSKIKSALK